MESYLKPSKPKTKVDIEIDNIIKKADRKFNAIVINREDFPEEEFWENVEDYFLGRERINGYMRIYLLDEEELEDKDCFEAEKYLTKYFLERGYTREDIILSDER